MTKWDGTLKLRARKEKAPYLLSNSETMSYKILLVEDEKDLSLIVTDTLRGQGYEVIIAVDGIDGLKKFKEEGADIVVADVMMPKMDGFTMAKEIRKLSSVVPLLFLTAKGSIDDVEEGCHYPDTFIGRTVYGTIALRG